MRFLFRANQIEAIQFMIFLAFDELSMEKKNLARRKKYQKVCLPKILKNFWSFKEKINLLQIFLLKWHAEIRSNRTQPQNSRSETYENNINTNNTNSYTNIFWSIEKIHFHSSSNPFKQIRNWKQSFPLLFRLLNWQQMPQK